MVSQAANKIVRDIDKLNDSEIHAVSEYIFQLLSRRTPNTNENHLTDELIAALSDRRENRCARQVVEWEKTRRRNLPKAV